MIGLAGLQAWRRVELDVEAVFIPYYSGFQHAIEVLEASLEFSA